MVFIDKTRDGVVSAVTDVEVRDVACGQNHVVVADCVCSTNLNPASAN